MRVMMISTGLMLAASLGACDRNESADSTEAPAAPGTATSGVQAGAAAGGAAGAQAQAQAALPKLGGTVIAAEELYVEVLPKADGKIEAAVRTKAGADINGAAGANLTLQVKGSDGANHPVAMAWNPPTARFTGQIAGAVHVVPGPVAATFVMDGETSTGRIPTIAVAPLATHGGAIVLAGDVSAEIKAEADGNVQAYLTNAAGAQITGDAGAQLTVNLKGSDMAMHPVALRWDAAKASFVGKLEGGVRVVPGPMELVVQMNGMSHRGRLEAIALAPAPRFGGEIVVAGDYAVEIVPKANGVVEAFVINPAGSAAGSADLDLTLNVGAGAAAKPLVLVWDPALARYRGEVRGGLDLRAMPIEVVVDAQGRRQYGHIAGAAAFGGGMNVDARAAHRAHADVRVTAPSVEVRAPSIDVRAAADPAIRAGARVRGDIEGAGARVRGNIEGAGARVRAAIPQPPSVSAGFGVRAGASGSAGAAARPAPPPPPAKASGKASGSAGFRIGGGGGIGIGN